MENASDALIMAFAVLIFVIALSVAMNAFNQAKATSDIVLYSADATNYYDYQDATGVNDRNRIVGLETIIPTLYTYFNSGNVTVLFRDATGGGYNRETGEFTTVNPLVIYKTQSRYTANNGAFLWGKKDTKDGTKSTYDVLMQTKYENYFTNWNYEEGSEEIFSFDLQEEEMRREVWTGSIQKEKEHLDCFLEGKPYYNPNKDGEIYIDYRKQGTALPYKGSGIGFVKRCSELLKNYQFIETIGEYDKGNSQSEDSTAKDEYDLQIGSTVSSTVQDKNNRTNYKRIVIFTLVNKIDKE